MNKINFVNNQEPALNSTNLNLLQSNIETEINTRIEELDNKKVEILNITTGVEFKTGRIIDGKEEYGKRINLGQLPNTSEKAVAHGINLHNINITYFDAYCLQGDNDLVYRLPHIGSEERYNISIWLDSSNINIKTFSNRTAYTGYATLYYTQK